MVKLRRTNFRIVHKVANTVGRVMTTGINIANKSSAALESHDQPELDARYVYVGVHADGPTRVLCFGETRDEYTRGTNEETVTLLTQKLKSLEERNRVSRWITNCSDRLCSAATDIGRSISSRPLQEVDAQLRSIDEKQNIDMALVMGASTDRAGEHMRDQMKIPNIPSMRLGRERTMSRDLAAVGSLVSISRAPSLSRSVSLILNDFIPGLSCEGYHSLRRPQVSDEDSRIRTHEILMASLQDPRPHSPREESGSPTDDESKGNPNLMRKSIALIKKVSPSTMILEEPDRSRRKIQT